MQPDETSGIIVAGHVKIYDPISNDIYVNKRCDGIPVAKPAIASQLHDMISNPHGTE